MVIHHFNKGKKEYSGTSDFYAAPDVLMKWTRERADQPGRLKVEGRMAPVVPFVAMLTPSTLELLNGGEIE